jgi:hypothetical protein
LSNRTVPARKESTADAVTLGDREVEANCLSLGDDPSAATLIFLQDKHALRRMPGIVSD